jgi:hypothetical protein
MDYVDEIYLKAQEIQDPGDRASYLWDACCGDTNFLERVLTKLSEAIVGGHSLSGPRNRMSGTLAKSLQDLSDQQGLKTQDN